VSPPPPAPLDWRGLAAALRGEPLGHRLVYLDSTPSTNDAARDLAAAGAPDGTVVVADAQTAGRGRAGKSPWLTRPRTSLAVSVLLRPPPAFAPAALPQLGMAAGVAARAAVREAAAVDAGLKWPNDVVAGGRKLGGILVESALSGREITYAVAGIGLNVNLPAAALGDFPDAALAPTTLLDLTGGAVSREALLLVLLRHLGRLVLALYRQQPAAVLGPYREAQTLVGQAVRVAGAGGAPVDGVAEAVADDGALVLRLPGGDRRRFAYGEVTLRPTPPASPSAGRRP
jgi:BirA family transcriptional regulator, biotin operon repressor / biotin---[acetyl-CoA-carboxylase] ligase